MNITIRQRVLLAAPALGAFTPARSARAAPNTICFARQFSMGYLQLNLVEKYAHALGLDGVTAEWLTFNAPDAMNGALISGTVEVVSGGIPGLVTLWSRTVGTAQEMRGVCALFSSHAC